MKIVAIIKGIVTYVFALFFAVIFALFLNANVGWFILLTLMTAPVISVLFSWIGSKFVDIECEPVSVTLAKGDLYHISVRVKNRFLFPTPPIDLELTDSLRLPCENKAVLVSVMPFAHKDFSVSYRAKICGMAKAGISQIRVTDYLGLFSFPIKVSCSKPVYILPDVAEVSARDDKIIKAMQTSMLMDDSDDTVEHSSYTFGGFPGYENREYVPGDPVKRINWKQSVKRDTLLVRLDDEITSKTIDVVLDSVYVDIADPLAEQMAVENALGIMRVLLMQNYKVAFHYYDREGFVYNKVTDEADLEQIRHIMAKYAFLKGEVPRYPAELSYGEHIVVYATPNPYDLVYTLLEHTHNFAYTTIYASQSAKKQEEPAVKSGRRGKKKEKEKFSVKALVIPYTLALLLSMVVFAVFEVPALSYWTFAQILVCAVMMLFSEYVKRHTVIGPLLSLITIMGLLYLAVRVIFLDNGGLNYMHWFMSGGESVESTVGFLASLLIIFTVFFSLVVFYFIRTLYRTSFLLLTSLVPFVIHVKVMQEINMVHVVLVTMLNLAAFLFHNRLHKDKEKRIVGYKTGLCSILFFLLIPVLSGLTLPDAKTRYYYVFENLFLGGNVSEEVPDEYSSLSEYSGNADGFNTLNDRKLYEIHTKDIKAPLYMKRQTFDLYDYKNHRWYPMEDSVKDGISYEEWTKGSEIKSLYNLIVGVRQASEYNPGIFVGYENLDELLNMEPAIMSMQVVAQNYANEVYVMPHNAMKMLDGDTGTSVEALRVSKNETFVNPSGYIDKYKAYYVYYYEETPLRNQWISLRGTNYTLEDAYAFQKKVLGELDAHNHELAARAVKSYLDETKAALDYQKAYADNAKEISPKVQKLAKDITKSCKNDYEKALALEKYFETNDFIYDLSYDAKDDSVEYFLFESKRGTCSDFASAYVLMARSVGLVARYTEGFATYRDYSGRYVVRTSNGHAYPEVFIPNVGYVAFEATRASQVNTELPFESELTSYFFMALIRMIMVLALLSLATVCILLMHRVVAPFMAETWFRFILKKKDGKEALSLLYKRLLRLHAKKYGCASYEKTPYEFAILFEKQTGYDISTFVYKVEKASYSDTNMTETDKKIALAQYKEIKKIIRAKVPKKTKYIP